jgi:hypothetical protein
MKLMEFVKERNHYLSPCLGLKVGSSTARLDDILHDCLRLVPIILVELHQIDTIMGSDLRECSKTLSVEDEAYADTDTSESASSTNAVKISLWIRLCITSALHGNIVIDDHGHRGDINTTGKNVGRDENLRLSCSEVLNDAVAL